jgi:hypothetical protein
VITSVMRKFLKFIHVFYFCLICFGLSISPSSEAGVQIRQWIKSAGYGVSARDRRLTDPLSATPLLVDRKCQA